MLIYFISKNQEDTKNSANSNIAHNITIDRTRAVHGPTKHRIGRIRRIGPP